MLERGGARGSCVHETFKSNGSEMRPKVEAELFQRKKTLALARWLLGKHLVRRFADGRIDSRMITETEAYNGEHDLACHARAGRTGWLTIGAVVISLFVGASVLMASIAFSLQRYFEHQVDEGRKISQ